MCENEYSYDVTKFSDKEISDKLDKVNSDLDYHNDAVSILSEEQSYLYDEKNKRFAEKEAICPACQTVREKVSMETSPETKWYCSTCKAGSA